MLDRTCSIDGCERERHGKDWCDPHYRRSLKFGDPLGGPAIRAKSNGPTVCCVAGCTRGRSSAGGWCSMHQQRMVRTGTLDDPQPPGECEVPECARTQYARSGLCSMHRRRWQKTGTTDPRLKRAKAICTVEGCASIGASGWGWCSKHYDRWRDNGDPTRTSRQIQIDQELETGQRTCVACKESKPLGAFRLSTGSLHGRMRSCDSCDSARLAKWHRSRLAADSGALRRRTRDSHLRRLYGITFEQYEAMLTAQGSRCAVCARTDPLLVDHCHETGAVRGLLCKDCNFTLGRVHDSVDVLRALIDYLQEHPATAVLTASD